MSEKILTKEYICSLGYEVEEIDYRIFLIKNFLLDEEVSSILQIASDSTQEDWESHYMEGVIEMAKLKFGRTDIDNLIEEGLYQITTNWIDKALKIKDEKLKLSISKRSQELFNFVDYLHFNGCGTIQRQYEGVPLIDHVDNHTDNSLEYAAVFYLNDNYNGGEVYFLNQKIELKPPKKSLLIFPTSEKWRHGVKEVLSGPTRYVIPSFISRKNFWEIHEQNGYNVDKTLNNIKS